MGGVAVLGEEPLIRGYALAGARLFAADDPAQVRAAWRDLPAGFDVVILTAFAGQVLGDIRDVARPLVVVMR